MSHRSRRPSPAFVLAALALFFALGGTSFAISRAVAPQARCQPGAVRAVAVVTGDPHAGIENLPATFSNAPVLFGSRFNCTGGAISVRKAPGLEGADVLFSGVRGTPIVTSLGDHPSGAAVEAQPDGSWRVRLASDANEPDGHSYDAKLYPFVIVVF